MIPGFFDQLQEAYEFISSSAVHPKWCAFQAELHPNERARELRSLSTTRWNCRFQAVDTLFLRFKVYIAVLEDSMEHDPDARQARAQSLYSRIDGSFIVFMSIMRWILRIVNDLSCQLQSTSLSLATAIQEVRRVHGIFARYSSTPNISEELWTEEIWSPAEDLCRDLGIPCVPTRRVRSVRSESTHSIKCADDYKRLFSQICSELRDELQTRFLEESQQVKINRRASSRSSSE